MFLKFLIGPGARKAYESTVSFWDIVDSSCIKVKTLTCCSELF